MFPIFKDSLFSSCLRFFSLTFFLCSLLDNEIVCFLKVQLAEAINLQDKNLMAQLQETMRCVSRFDNRTCRKLLASIAEDYRYLCRGCPAGAPRPCLYSPAGWEDPFWFKLHFTKPGYCISASPQKDAVVSPV